MADGSVTTTGTTTSYYDSRYDSRYVNITGDTMTGELTLNDGLILNGFLEHSGDTYVNGMVLIESHLFVHGVILMILIKYHMVILTIYMVILFLVKQYIRTYLLKMGVLAVNF